MHIEKLEIGPMGTNCYLAICPDTSAALIIDPGYSADFITQKILDLKLKPKSIMVTHAHIDHIMGVLELKLNFGIPFMVNKKDLFLLKRADETAEYFLGPHEYKELSAWKEAEKLVDYYIRDGEEITFGEERVKVIETMGHTPGSVCFYSKGFLFSGDTLFKGGVGRTDLSYSWKEGLERSLKKLAKLPPETIVYPGHGPETTIEEELKD